MNAGRVHAMLAAGLADLRLLQRWTRRPEALRSGGVAPETVDLDALAKFAGLVAKVRHNGLRGDFPLTFRMLAAAGLEIDLFAAYAGWCADHRRAFAADPVQRGADLIAFIRRWMEPCRADHVRLFDIVRHEDALARLRRAPATAEGRALGKDADERAIPVIRGALVLEQYRYDPEALAALLRRPAARLDTLEPGEVRRGYWRPAGEAEIRILDLDLFAYELLARADGEASADRLSRQLTGEPPTAGFLGALDRLAEAGLIGFA
jgi:hypothetical protein